MKNKRVPIFFLIASLVVAGSSSGRPSVVASSATVVNDLRRFPSPSGRYDVVFEPLPKDWTHVQKAQPGIVRETMEKYAVTMYPAKSNQPVNVMYFADEGTPPPPEEL